MSIDAREKLLEVAARVYAEAGYRGTTTRRIAQEAGLNEVTLFRHFGSKDALLREAIERRRPAESRAARPRGGRPDRRAASLGARRFQRFYRQQNLIRQVLGDIVQRPEIAPSDLRRDDTAEFDQLIIYLRRARGAGHRAHRRPVAARGKRRDAGTCAPEPRALARSRAQHAGAGRVHPPLRRSPAARRRGAHSCCHP